MKRVLLGELLEEVADKTTVNDQYPVLTSSKSGLFLQSDYFNKQVASKNNVGYKIIKKGQFTYRAMSDTGEFFPNMLECTEIGIVSPAYPVFKNIKQNEVTNEFLKYYFKSGIFQNAVSHFAQGSTRTSVKFGKLKTITIELPRVEEQVQIVAKLKKLDHLISLQRQQISLIEEVVKSRFLELFGDPVSNPMGWIRKTLQQLVTVEPQNGLYKPQSDYVQDKSGVPILRIDAFYNGKVTSFENLKRLVCSDTEKERYLLKENDIVINRVNSIEYLGKCAHISGMLEDTVFESNMMRFHLDEEQTDAVFITHLLCSKYIYNQILRTAKKAVNQASINQKDVLGFEIYVPPLELQQQFAVFVAQVDKSKLAVQQGLQELETLKKSLMQQYFG